MTKTMTKTVLDHNKLNDQEFQFDNWTKTAQEEYQHLLKFRSNIEAQIEKCQKKIRQEYIDSCPSYELPVDVQLNWWGNVVDSVGIDCHGQVLVNTHVPSIRNGYDNENHKAGTSFVLLKSWKTNKRTIGTHHILLNKHTGRVTHLYA